MMAMVVFFSKCKKILLQLSLKPQPVFVSDDDDSGEIFREEETKKTSDEDDGDKKKKIE